MWERLSSDTLTVWTVPLAVLEYLQLLTAILVAVARESAFLS